MSRVLAAVHDSWEPCITASESYLAARGLQDMSQFRLGSLILGAKDALVAEHDKLADRLGQSFADGDSTFEQEFLAVAEGDLANLLDLITSQMATESVDAPNWNVPAGHHFRSAKDESLRALQDLASRQGYKVSTRRSSDVISQRSLTDREDLTYCQGATALQEATADVFSVLKQLGSSQQFGCTYCYLEISDFRSSGSTFVAEDWLGLASCHLLACSSLRDRRATFRCFDCYSHGKDTFEVSPAAFCDHISVCRFTKMRKKRRTGPSNATSHLPPPIPALSPARSGLPSPGTQNYFEDSYTTRQESNLLPGGRDDYPSGRATPQTQYRSGSPLASAAAFGDGATSPRRVPGGSSPTQLGATNASRSPRASTPAVRVSSPSRTSSTADTPIYEPPNFVLHGDAPQMPARAAPTRPSRRTPSPRGDSQQQPWASTAGTGTSNAPGPYGDVSSLTSIGMSRADAEDALRQTGGDFNAAADMYWSRA